MTIAKRILRIILIIVITFVLLELLTRLWFGGLASAVESPNTNAQLFPDGLYISATQLAPNYSAVAPTGITYTTNEYGLRDEPIATDKPLWLFLGDSTTFGLNIEHAQTYTEGVERLAGGTIQVVNAAVPGWGTGEQYDALNMLLDNGYTFEHVTVAFFANDPRNVMIYDARNSGNAAFDQLLNQSYFYRLVSGLGEKFAIDAALNTDWRQDSQRPNLWQYPEWERTRYYLDAIVTTAQEHGAVVSLLYIPWNENDVFGESPIDAALREYATDHTITYLSGVDVYRAYLTAHDLSTIPAGFYSRGDDMAHPGILSSQLLAQAIYEHDTPTTRAASLPRQ